MFRLVATCFILCSVVAIDSASASWQVGNGGDALRLAFAKSKKSASHMTLKVKKQSFGSDVSSTVVNWILENREALASDILSSKHQWTLEAQPTCAWTTTTGETREIIDFSYPTCRKSIGGFGQAVALLIHESVHHFGIDDEEFADKVSLAIVEAWKSGKTEWLTISADSSPEARKQHSAIWNGSRMIIYGGLTDDENTKNLNTGFIFCPDTFAWEAIETANAPARHGHTALWTGDSMIVWGGFKITNGKSNWQNSGAIWDAATNSWEKIAPPFGPEETGDFSNFRQSQTAVWTGKKLIVWGSVDAEGDSIGSIYDLKTKVWKKLSDAGSPMRKWGHSAVWADGKMIVWGGVDGAKRRTDKGAVYDLSSDSWTQMSTDNSPTKTERHSAVWTGNQMIVFGGFDSGAGLKGKGGTYNLSTNSWTKFETESTMARTGQTAVWDGSDLLVFGGKSKRFRTYLNNVASFNPISQVWKSKQGLNSPAMRNFHTAVWTGTSLIIWGGAGKNRMPMATGGIYYP